MVRGVAHTNAERLTDKHFFCIAEEFFQLVDRLSELKIKSKPFQKFFQFAIVEQRLLDAVHVVVGGSCRHFNKMRCKLAFIVLKREFKIQPGVIKVTSAGQFNALNDEGVGAGVFNPLPTCRCLFCLEFFRCQCRGCCGLKCWLCHSSYLS